LVVALLVALQIQGGACIAASSQAMTAEKKTFFFVIIYHHQSPLIIDHQISLIPINHPFVGINESPLIMIILIIISHYLHHYFPHKWRISPLIPPLLLGFPQDLDHELGCESLGLLPQLRAKEEASLQKRGDGEDGELPNG
jgi:hypothetical protein